MFEVLSCIFLFTLLAEVILVPLGAFVVWCIIRLFKEEKPEDQTENNEEAS